MLNIIKIIIYFYLILIISNESNGQVSAAFIPTIHNAGISVLIPNGYDDDYSAKVTIEYGENINSLSQAFPPTRLNVLGLNEFKGSLFFLKANTQYYVKINYLDSFPSINKLTIVDSFKTNKELVIAAQGNIKYVSPSGSGTAYTESQPGDLKTVLQSGLTCGTTILLKNGTYYTGDISINLNSNCTENTPITIMTAPGEKAILDGGLHQNYTWSKLTGDTNIYYTNLPVSADFTALCVLDSLRLYPYATLNYSTLFGYPNLQDLTYEESGFYRKDGLIYIKTLDYINPNNSKVILGKSFSCITVNGNDKQSYLQIKDIDFQYYGKGLVQKNILNLVDASYPSYTMTLKNTNKTIIENCHFLFSNFPITFEGNCNSNVVQNCKIKDNTGYWAHGAFKNTRDENVLEQASYNRYLENSGIAFFPNNNSIAKGNVIRNNYIEGVVGGISLGFNATGYKMLDNDVYNNTVYKCYDGIDAISLGNGTSGVSNTRIYRNEISEGPVGISLISPSLGPNYIMYNLIHHIRERKNYHTDVFFMDCNNKLSTKIWGTGLKLNSGANADNPGDIYLFNNTFHGMDSLAFCMYIWTPTWKKMTCINNIFYNEGLSTFFFDDIKNQAGYSFLAKNNTIFNKKGQLSTIQPINGIPNCITSNNLIDMQSSLKLETGSSQISCSGSTQNPQMKSDFHLTLGSDAIDAGDKIQGITLNNYKGLAPDRGAFESGNNSQITKEKNITSIKVFPNPNKGNFEIISDFNIENITIYNLLGMEINSKISINKNKAEIKLEYYSSGIYILKVNEISLKILLE